MKERLGTAASAGRRVGLKSTLAWSALDAGASVARNRQRLRDRTTRTGALREVLWDTGESAASGIASAGAMLGVGTYLATAPVATAAAGATTTAVVGAAPLAVAVGVGHATRYVVRKVRRVSGRQIGPGTASRYSAERPC
jgi:DNA mismatch repair protein MutH